MKNFDDLAGLGIPIPSGWWCVWPLHVFPGVPEAGRNGGSDGRNPTLHSGMAASTFLPLLHYPHTPFLLINFPYCPLPCRHVCVACLTLGMTSHALAPPPPHLDSTHCHCRHLAPSCYTDLVLLRQTFCTPLPCAPQF